MGYVTLGQKLGRATRAAVDRLQEPHDARPGDAREPKPALPRSLPQPARMGGSAATAASVVRQGKRAGQSFWKRLAYVARMLWHEVTGVFFSIFALFFAQGAWRVRADYKQGAEHEHFLLYLAMTVLFAYFAISAFVRSRKPHVG